MRNLLWKFVALAGVAGVGFMVVLQVMEGLSGVPNLPGQQAAAASKEQGEPAPALKPPLPQLPPLQTKETVAMADPFPPLPTPEPAAETLQPFDDSEEPQPEPALAFPAPEPELPGADSLPLEFPVPAKDAQSSEPQLPELPVRVPNTGATEAPNVEAFTTEVASERAPTEVTQLPQLPPQPELPVPGTDDPFSDPVSAPVEETSQPTGPAFDPYEPLPASGEAKNAETAAQEKAPAEPTAPSFPSLEPRAEQAPQFPRLNAPELPALPPGGVEQGQPTEVSLPPASAPKTDSPEILLPFPEPQPQEERSAEIPPPVEQPAPESNNFPNLTPPLAEGSGTPKPAGPVRENETVPDPFDAPNPPYAPPPTPEPGRAKVQTPEADGSPEKPPYEPSAPGAPNAPPAAPPTTSQAPMPPIEQPAPEMKAFPNITTPLVEGSGTAPSQGPVCAVPMVAGSESAPARAVESADSPFVDPLDQLTFPAAPAVSEVPEHTKPEHHLTPVAGTEPAPAESPRLPNTDPGPLPEINPRPLGGDPAVSTAPGASPEIQNPPAGPETPTEAPVANAAPPNVMEGVGVLDGADSLAAQQPKLKIEKTAPPKAVLNQPMIYHILVRNVGSTAAHEVIVEDQVPKGTQLTGTIPRGEMANSRLIWRLGVIDPGEEKKIAVRVIPTQEGQIGSVAKVSFVAEVAARTVVAAPKLALALTGPANAVVGDALTYHFQLENTGTGDANNVFLRNILPEGLSHPSGDDLEYEVGLLKAGEKKEIDLTVNAAKAGDFANKAIVAASGGLNVEATAKVKILGDRLTITRTGPKRRYVGRTASYSNTIANQSDSKVENVRVVEVLPAGMDFVKATAGGQYDPNNRTVTWAIAELGPKDNQLLQLELMARKEGPQASEVTAFDPNGSRAVVKSETAVDGYTALRLDVGEYNDPVDVGEQVGLRVVATNRGTRATANVVVKLIVPEEMEFVSAKGPVDFKRDGATLTFNPIPSLDARGEMAFDLVLKSLKAGDARIRLEIHSDEVSKPLVREDGIRILAKRP